jgi:ferredoxin-NADP reductase
MTLKTFPLQVERTTHITPTIIEVAFRRADGEPLVYTAGQFLNIHIEAGGELAQRSYSIATAPQGEDGIVAIAVSPVKGGLATDLLFGLSPGDRIVASGPYGRFVLRDDPPGRYVLAGTGTGVTPYRAMLPELERRLASGQHSVELLLGVWRREELLYGRDFVNLAARHPQFRFHACYSREFPETPEPWERRGYVQTHFANLGLDPAKDVIYLCGNPDMIDQAMEQLRAMNFPTRNLRREKYLPSRTGPHAPST